MSDASSFAALVELCARLRDPEGCPWDREQTLDSLRTYIIEEAYEVVDAITEQDHAELMGELGDLLFQIVFVADIAKENGWFDIEDVCSRISAKMVRRHPHVFGDVKVSGASQVVQNWEAIKQGERVNTGALSGVPRNLPALLKALRITEKAAAVGFDWERVDDVIAKIEEEVKELSEEVARNRKDKASARVREEMGDVLFAMANLARQLGIDPEVSLQEANQKFINRFTNMERLAAGRDENLRTLGATALNDLWEEVKSHEPMA